MLKLSLHPVNATVTVSPGSLLLPALLGQKLNIAMSCGGNGICSTCHVRVREGADQLSPMQGKERRTLALVADADATSRLACQTHVEGDGVCLELPRGMYIEKAEDLLGLLGLRAPDNILHPIRGHVLIPLGKIITRTLLEQSRALDDEVKRMKEGLIRPGDGPTMAAPGERGQFAASGRGIAPRLPVPAPIGPQEGLTTRRMSTTQRMLPDALPGTQPPTPQASAAASPSSASLPPAPPPQTPLKTGPPSGPRPTSQSTPEVRTGSSTVRLGLRSTERVSVSLAAQKDLTADLAKSPPPDSDAPPAIGSQVGKFLMVACIGKGGLGLVYRALHTTLNISVAVKFLRNPGPGGVAPFLDRFRAEARLLSQLNHPNVVRVLDFEDDPKQPYVVMDLVEGVTLQDLLAQTGRLWWDRAVALLLQAVDGLEAAWRLGIVHRDVKPANIMVTREGTAKVVDFGLAVQVDTVASNSARANESRSQVAGTVAYMCPERALNPLTIDLRADIYSLGVTFFEMVTGRLPFTASTALEVMMAHYCDPMPSAHEMAPDVPVAVSGVIDRMTAKQPSDRYQSYDEVRAALAAIHNPSATTTTR